MLIIEIMDEIHVHKTKKSICAHFAESPCINISNTVFSIYFNPLPINFSHVPIKFNLVSINFNRVPTKNSYVDKPYFYW